ncbi:unnamed protein product [Amoebophrya sp. A25]|nr:unnamed protein product [Amoebophrya sp. A25]|eukprot:GSA25T00025961001.1
MSSWVAKLGQGLVGSDSTKKIELDVFLCGSASCYLRIVYLCVKAKRMNRETCSSDRSIWLVGNKGKQRSWRQFRVSLGRHLIMVEVVAFLLYTPFLNCIDSRLSHSLCFIQSTSCSCSCCLFSRKVGIESFVAFM